MSLIRFGLMPKSDLDEIAKDFSLSGCDKILFTAWKNTLNPYGQPLVEGDKNRIRLDHPLVYIFGGKDATDNYNRNLLMSEVSLKQGNVSLSPFTEVGQTPFALSDSSCAAVNGYVFVSGGEGESGIVDSLFRFDPRTNTWLELEGMNQKRFRHTLTAMGDTLVAVGGWDGKTSLGGAEKYDIRNNTWAVIEPLPHGRIQHAAACVDDVLYITGGTFTKTLYILSDNVWTEKSPMLHDRQCHAMTGISGMIVVAGGTVKEDGKWLDVMSTECYDISQDQWTELTPPQFACQLAFSTRIGNWFYILGGYSDHEKNTMDKVQRYNIETNQWTLSEINLPVKLNRLVGASIVPD